MKSTTKNLVKFPNLNRGQALENFWKNSRGQAVIMTVILFITIVSAIVMALSNSVLSQIGTTQESLSSRQSFYLAESGIEDTFYRFNNNWATPSSRTLSLNGYTTNITITDILGGKRVQSTGDYREATKHVFATLQMGTGVSFHYGVQVGNGGISITGNGAGVQGNVYSNGNITGVNNADGITGSAVAVSTINNVDIGQEAKANIVNNSTVNGNLYCKSGTENNKPCNTSQDIPTPLAFPISDENIAQWKRDAEAGGVLGSQTFNSDMSLGPNKINGNLIVNQDLVITGTLWVTGYVRFGGHQIISLDPDYGSNDGLIIADGSITLENHTTFTGSGTSGSYIMLLSTSTGNAIIQNDTQSSGAVIFNAQKGTVQIGGNHAEVKEVVANQIVISGTDAVVIYETGVADAVFTSGPSGGWEMSDWDDSP